MRIAELERAAGVPLVRRTTRSVGLTEAGQQLVDDTQRRVHAHRAELCQRPRPGGNAARPGARDGAGGAGPPAHRADAGGVPAAAIPRSASSSTSPTASSTSRRKASTWPSATPRRRPIRMWPGSLCAARSVLVASSDTCAGTARPAAGGPGIAPLPAVPARRGEPELVVRARGADARPGERVIVTVTGPCAPTTAKCCARPCWAGWASACCRTSAPRRTWAPRQLVRVLPQWQPRGFFGERLYAIRPWAPPGPARRAVLRGSLAPGPGAGFQPLGQPVAGHLHRHRVSHRTAPLRSTSSSPAQPRASPTARARLCS